MQTEDMQEKLPKFMLFPVFCSEQFQGNSTRKSEEPLYDRQMILRKLGFTPGVLSVIDNQKVADNYIKVLKENESPGQVCCSLRNCLVPGGRKWRIEGR